MYADRRKSGDCAGRENIVAQMFWLRKAKMKTLKRLWYLRV
jgi:hypothetical protein